MTELSSPVLGTLSLANILGGSGFLCAALLCWRAGVAGKAALRPDGEARSWYAIAAFFLVLSLIRWLALDWVMHDALRSWFEAHGVYGRRQYLQLPLTILVLVFGFCLVAAMLFRAQRPGRDRTPRSLRFAWMAALALALLAVLRTISLHDMDSLLFGGLHLNRVVLAGATFAALWAAWAYRREAIRR